MDIANQSIVHYLLMGHEINVHQTEKKHQQNCWNVQRVIFFCCAHSMWETQSNGQTDRHKTQTDTWVCPL